MVSSYIFSGFGHSAGKYSITNDYIADALRKDFLSGFDENRMSKSENYLKYKETHPEISPFDYFVREKMGFVLRKHVTPFPPTRKKLYYADTSVELGVEAVKMALKNANISPKEISAWFVSTVSPHQKAPGIAALIKSHFVDYQNFSPTFTITSGCSGFNINLERALEYFEIHSEVKHLLVGHTETMSNFLTQRVKFVPFVTFADGAAFVVLSRIQTEKKQGIIAINNFQDPQMIDYVGVDSNRNLYMSDSLIKDRAIENIPKAAEKALTQSGWKSSEVDLCVPHQTGNAILLPAVEKLNIRKEKLYLDAQYSFGNISGATVPIALSLLNKENKLKSGMKILSPVAGVGGNYGAFSYLVPEQKTHTKKLTHLFVNDLQNKKILVLGASGTLGFEISKELIKRGAEVILHFNKNKKKIDELVFFAKNEDKKVQSYQADFNNRESTELFISEINKQYKEIHYFINTAGVLMSRKENKVMKINYLSPLNVFKKILPILRETAIFVGAASEDINVPEIQEFISSKRSLHGVLASMSGELMKKKNTVLWYIPGVLSKGMLRNIDTKALYRFMIEIGQKSAIDAEKVAVHIVNSLYIPKVKGTNDEYQNAMIIRRDGYKLQVDI